MVNKMVDELTVRADKIKRMYGYFLSEEFDEFLSEQLDGREWWQADYVFKTTHTINIVDTDGKLIIKTGMFIGTVGLTEYGFKLHGMSHATTENEVFFTETIEDLMFEIVTGEK